MHKTPHVSILVTLALGVMVASACTQTYSQAPLATPTLISTGLFVSPFPSGQDPLQVVAGLGTQTAAAKTAQAGGGTTTPSTAAAISGTPATQAAVTATPTMGTAAATTNAASTVVPATTKPTQQSTTPLATSAVERAGILHSPAGRVPLLPGTPFQCQPRSVAVGERNYRQHPPVSRQGTDNSAVRRTLPR